MSHPHDALHALLLLLRGHPEAARRVANTLRVEAHGVTAFGRTDALDHFARHPLALSATPRVLTGSDALAMLDVDADGETVGVFADLVDGTVARVWVAGPVADDARPEAAVSVAVDDFLHQDRVVCAGEARDHPRLAAPAWPLVQAAAVDALAAAAQGAAASSSQAWVVRAFSDGGGGGGGGGVRDGDGDGFAAFLALRVQASSAPGMPRGAHCRWAVAIGRVSADGGLLHRQLAVSAAWPVPANVQF